MNEIGQKFSDKPFLRTPVRWHITTPPKTDNAAQCSEAQ